MARNESKVVCSECGGRFRGIKELRNHVKEVHKKIRAGHKSKSHRNRQEKGRQRFHKPRNNWDNIGALR